MRRTCLVGTIIVTMTLLAGCGSDDDDTKPPNSPAPTTVTTVAPSVVGNPESNRNTVTTNPGEQNGPDGNEQVDPGR